MVQRDGFFGNARRVAHEVERFNQLVASKLVLAADARTTREGEIIAPASVVTFALKEKDRLTMINAKEMGILSLSLRKLNDESKAQYAKVTGKTVLGIKDEIASAPRPAPSVAEAVAPPPVDSSAVFLSSPPATSG